MKKIGEIQLIGQPVANRPLPSLNVNTASDSEEILDRIDAFLHHFFMPTVTPVQRAYLIEDWFEGLKVIELRFVIEAFREYANSSQSLDDRGRMIKPGIALIRKLAFQARRNEEIRNMPKLPPPPPKEPEPEMTLEELRFSRARLTAWAKRRQGETETMEEYLAVIHKMAEEIVAEQNIQQSPEIS